MKSLFFCLVLVANFFICLSIIFTLNNVYNVIRSLRFLDHVHPFGIFSTRKHKSRGKKKETGKMGRKKEIEKWMNIIYMNLRSIKKRHNLIYAFMFLTLSLNWILIQEKKYTKFTYTHKHRQIQNERKIFCFVSDKHRKNCF